jgi:hypothetical protein
MENSQRPFKRARLDISNIIVSNSGTLNLLKRRRAESGYASSKKNRIDPNFVNSVIKIQKIYRSWLCRKNVRIMNVLFYTI